MIPLIKPFLAPRKELIPEIQKTLYSGYIAQGEKVEIFEELIEKKLGLNKSTALTLNSGTSALHLALILAGVNKDDEVISTAWTAEPTNVAIKMMNAKIRYADIDSDFGNISVKSVISKINNKTKAIIVVDYAGMSVNVKELKLIEEKYNIPIIHDVAHSLGTTYKGLYPGHHFTFTAFSFQAIKHLTTIDGGCLVCKNSSHYTKGKKMRWFGLDKNLSRAENNITFQGYKYHMNDVNATIGITQFKYFDEIIFKHKKNGQFLNKMLQDITGIKLIESYAETEPSFWFYTLLVDKKDDFINYLNKNNISCSQVHKRNDQHSFLNDFNEDLPNLNLFLKKMIHIPCGWWLSKSDLYHIVNTIKRFSEI